MPGLITARKLLICASVCFAFTQFRVFAQELNISGDGNYTVGTAIISEAQFAPDSLAEMALSYLKQSRSEFFDLWFFASEIDAQAFRSGKLGVHISYDGWRPSYERIRGLRIPVAEFVSIKGSSVLLVRNKEGSVSRRIVVGQDPLILSVANRPVHLLHFSVTPVRPQSVRQRVSVSAWTDGRLEESFGLEILDALSRSLPVADLSVYLRADPWFIDEPAFPSLPAFSPEFNSPTREEYIHSPTLVCTLPLRGSRSCTLFRRHE